MNSKELISQVKILANKNPKLAQSLQTRSKYIKEKYNYGNKNTGFFAKMIPILMGFMVFFFVFLISGMALLKERTSGTLDRLLATPVKRSDIVFGYMLSYGILAIIQTIVIVLSTIWLLDIQVVGSGCLIIRNLNVYSSKIRISNDAIYSLNYNASIILFRNNPSRKYGKLGSDSR